jgi:RimJ/RimL family protein N-acetyltransferase
MTLTLRPCCPTDRTDFVALEQDPEVMRYLNGGHAVDRAKTPSDTGFLMPEGCEPELWTACRADNSFVGWFGLWPEPDGQAELGYRLARAAWGQGLATEGAAALVNWGFATQGLALVFACTMAVNQASRRVMQKTGMSYARTFHPVWPQPIAGSEEGEVEYAITREDWVAQQV